jgi:hypothetical protein
MRASPADGLLRDVSEFWRWAKADPRADAIGDPLVHRVRERWHRWWLALPVQRQEAISRTAEALIGDEQGGFLRSLRDFVELDAERTLVSAPGHGPADWVFMQFAHVEPFEHSGLFAQWRLDNVTGFCALGLEPESDSKPGRSRSIFVALVSLRDTMGSSNGSTRQYVYNATLREKGGASNAVEAAVHLLKRSQPFFFAGRPRGIRHLPNVLRWLFTISLIGGSACAFALYVAASTRHLSDALATRLVAAAFVATIVFLAAWLIGLGSDWYVERQLAAALAGYQVAWAFGDVLPTKHSRNAIDIEGNSFAAALALGILHAAHGGADSWIAWCVRRAADNMRVLGITGDVSPSGRILPVNLDGKNEICSRERRRLCAPDQRDSREIADGRRVRIAATLEGLVWNAADLRSGLSWLAATVAVLLVLFSIEAYAVVSPPAPPELDVRHPPITESTARDFQYLTLHFRSERPRRFLVRLRSPFWKAGEQRLHEDANGESVVELDLVRQAAATGSTTDGVVEVLLVRHLPFMEMSPLPVEEITIWRLIELHQRSKR